MGFEPATLGQFVDQTAASWQTHPWVTESPNRVRFGIAKGPVDDWRTLAEFVLHLEELGLDSFWVSDHPMFSVNCWTTLAALAVTTRRIRLGSLVSCVYYRNPALLARMAADVDRMSAGRLVLGLGIGDLPSEFAQMGITRPNTRDRQEGLDEVLAIIRGSWGSAPSSPPGKHFGISPPVLSLGPVQVPRVPFLIAGGGERVTLRQVAQHADASNFGEHAWIGGVRSDEELQRRWAALQHHCTAFDRPSESVLRTHTAVPLINAETRAALPEKIERYLPPNTPWITGDHGLIGTPSDMVTHYSRLIRAGLQYFIAFIYGNDLDTVRLLAERVIPELPAPRQLAPA